MKKLKLAALATLLALGLIATPHAQTLSDQVLLLLSRANTWTATQTFTDVTISGTCTGCGGAGGGTVTSVAQTVPGALLSVSGSPIVGSGTLAISLVTQADNTVFAGPTAGGPLAPTFRALVDGDIPDTVTIAGTNNVTWASVDKTGSSLADLATRAASDLTGTLALANLTDDNVTADLPLVSGGAGGDPVYEALNLASATAITGQLAAANFPVLTGDVTTAGGSLATTLANSGVTAATYGSATAVGQFTVDAQGRITSASDVTIGTAALLSTTFCSDCAAQTPTRGSLIYVPVGGNWDELVVGTAGQFLRTDGTDVAWGTDGSALTALNGSNVASGLVGLTVGGSNKNMTAVPGGVVYTDADSMEVTAAGTASQCLLSNGAGAPSWGACATLAAHNLLSATHGDTVANTVTRGSIIYGDATPNWNELVIGSSGTMLRSNGTDISWSADGSSLTINADNLLSGTVPTARLPSLLFSMFSAQTTAQLFAVISDEVQPTGGVLVGTVPWTEVAFSAGNFTGNGSMTWTVESGDQDILQYNIMGNVMTIAFDIATTTVGGTPDSTLQIAMPGGVTVATKAGGAWIQPCWRIDNGTQANTVCSVDSAGTTLNIFADETTGSSTWTASTNNTRVSGILSFEIE